MSKTTATCQDCKWTQQGTRWATIEGPREVVDAARVHARAKGHTVTVKTVHTELKKTTSTRLRNAKTTGGTSSG